MALLNRFLGCLSFFLPRQYSKGKSSSLQEKLIQRPPEDTGVEKERAYEDSLVKMEILPDFSTMAEPLMIQVEEPEYQTLHAGVKIFPRSSTTVAKPLLFQVAPQHPLPDEVETSFSNVAEQLKVQFEEPISPDEGGKSPHFSSKVSEPLMDQEATWHLTPPAEEEILPSLSIVAEPLMVQMAPAEVEQERSAERRGRRRTKKERKTDSSTIKRPDATSPPKPKLAWMNNPAQNTKAEEERIKRERELEDKTPVKQETECVVEVDIKQKRRMKKERKNEYATPPPAKPKLAWMETDSTKVEQTEKREDEKRRPERQAKKIEDTKTEQAATAAPPAKGNKPECSSKIRQQSSKRPKGLLFIYKLAEKKVTAEKEKKKIRKD